MPPSGPRPQRDPERPPPLPSICCRAICSAWCLWNDSAWCFWNDSASLPDSAQPARVPLTHLHGHEY